MILLVNNTRYLMESVQVRVLVLVEDLAGPTRTNQGLSGALAGSTTPRGIFFFFFTCRTRRRNYGHWRPNRATTLTRENFSFLQHTQHCSYEHVRWAAGSADGRGTSRARTHMNHHSQLQVCRESRSGGRIRNASSLLQLPGASTQT